MGAPCHTVGWDMVCTMEVRHLPATSRGRSCSVALTVPCSGSDLELWGQERGAGPVFWWLLAKIGL